MLGIQYVSDTVLVPYKYRERERDDARLSSAHTLVPLLIQIRISILGVFPDGPVVKPPHSQCRGPRFNPWSGN